LIKFIGFEKGEPQNPLSDHGEDAAEMGELPAWADDDAETFMARLGKADSDVTCLMSPLSGIKSLEEVAGAARTLGWPRVRTLQLSFAEGSGVTMDQVVALFGTIDVSHIENLHLPELPDDRFAAMVAEGAVPALKWLCVNCSKVTDAGLLALCEGKHHLEQLDADSMKAVTKAGAMKVYKSRVPRATISFPETPPQELGEAAP